MSMSLMQMLHAATPTARYSAASPSNAATTSTSSPSSSTSSTDPGVDLTNTFLQLLSVQLENQSPIDPVDPNQFVTQLATFDSLGELTQIQELMQTLVTDVGGASTSAPGAANANLTSATSPNSISH